MNIFDYVFLFIKDKQGATALEYALIAGLIAVFIIISLSSVGQAIIEQFYDKIIEGLNKIGDW